MFSDSEESSAEDEEDGTAVDSVLEAKIDEKEAVGVSLAIRQFVADQTPQTTASPTASPLARIGLKDFELKSVIGQGAYGKVFLVQRRNRGQTRADTTSITSIISSLAPPEFYAMKVLRKATLVIHQKDTEHTWNERKILSAIAHPFIVKLYYAFQTSYKLYLILGYAPGGELFNYLSKEKMFAEEAVVFYSSELLLALEHLHGLGIIYRDLKPENCLLGNDGHILLTDFGLSKVSLDGARTICGTTEFLAPEIIQLDQLLENLKTKSTDGSESSSSSQTIISNSHSYTYLVDYWSLGIMIFDMLTGHPPFTGNNNRKVMENIIKKKLFCPHYMTAAAKDLCTKLLKKHPNARLGVTPASVRSHPFFRKLDWDRVLAKGYDPPIVPYIEDAADTSNFHDDFTTMAIHDTPPEEQCSDLRCAMLDQSGDSNAIIDHKATCMRNACVSDAHPNPFTGFSYVHHEFSAFEEDTRI